ncbi:MAG: hypothetical protein ACO3Z6_14190 [Pseudomonadales bacterium]
MSKYTLAKKAMEDALAAASGTTTSPAEMLEALVVLSVAEFAKLAGGQRAADLLRYELANVGGDVDTVFLRSR